MTPSKIKPVKAVKDTSPTMAEMVRVFRALGVSLRFSLTPIESKSVVKHSLTTQVKKSLRRK